MLPKTSEDLVTFTNVKQPSFTYYLDVEEEKVIGNTDGLEAIRQTIYKILNTERYQTLIYSWNYGIELKDLIGKSYFYVCSELPHRITEALTQDDRIKSVEGFTFSKKKNAVSVTFQVNTTEGIIRSGMEVKL